MSSLLVLILSASTWALSVFWLKRSGGGAIRSHVLGLVFGIFALVIGALVVTPTPAPLKRQKDEAKVATKPLPAASTAVEIADEKKAELRERRHNFAYTVIATLKESLNDPASFKLVNAYVTEQGGICIRYRAKNAFNATITKDLALDKAGKEQPVASVCNKKAGMHDMSYLGWVL